MFLMGAICDSVGREEGNAPCFFCFEPCCAYLDIRVLILDILVTSLYNSLVSVHKLASHFLPCLLGYLIVDHVARA